MAVSAKTGDGIDRLRQKISDLCALGEVQTANTLVSNLRHIDALGTARASLQSALDALDAGMPMDLCAIDVSAALESLGLITGVSVSADIVDTIFAQFCVGK